MNNHFSRSERAIAASLSHLPTIKLFLKRIYSGLAYLLYRKPYKIKTNCIVQCVTLESSQVFFGYFDKYPENSSGLLLAHVVPGNGRDFHKRKANIAVFKCSDLKEPLFLVGTLAFNWQQGCRAHWISESEFIFNDFNPGTDEYVSRIFSVTSGKITRSFYFPVQDSFAGKYFLSVDWKRLSVLSPDYGYFPDRASLTVKYERDADGITLVCIATGKADLIYSFRDICELNSIEEFGTKDHSVNHLTFSPDGEKFYFVHRYFVGGVRKDRLLLGDVAGSRLRELVGVGISSHFCWLSADKIFGYLRDERHPLGYYVIDIFSGLKESVQWLNDSGFGDGHPTCSGEGRLIIDTYPDRAQIQTLYEIDLEKRSIFKLGEFFHGWNFFGSARCDLHPRASVLGDAVYIDTVFSGKRQLCKLSISETSSMS